jgi:hypothetical protein
LGTGLPPTFRCLSRGNAQLFFRSLDDCARQVVIEPIASNVCREGSEEIRSARRRRDSGTVFHNSACIADAKRVGANGCAPRHTIALERACAPQSLRPCLDSITLKVPKASRPFCLFWGQTRPNAFGRLNPSSVGGAIGTVCSIIAGRLWQRTRSFFLAIKQSE